MLHWSLYFLWLFYAVFWICLKKLPRTPEFKSTSFVRHTLGARDFSSAVSGFCQVLRPKTCRPSANTETSRRTREKPLVPRERATSPWIKNIFGFSSFFSFRYFKTSLKKHQRRSFWTQGIVTWREDYALLYLFDRLPSFFLLKSFIIEVPSMSFGTVTPAMSRNVGAMSIFNTISFILQEKYTV